MELANHNQEILNPAASIAELFSPSHLLGSSLPLIATFCQFHLLNGSPISGLLAIGHGPCLAQGLRVSGLVSLNNFPPGAPPSGTSVCAEGNAPANTQILARPSLGVPCNPQAHAPDLCLLL